MQVLVAKAQKVFDGMQLRYQGEVFEMPDNLLFGADGKAADWATLPDGKPIPDKKKST